MDWVTDNPLLIVVWVGIVAVLYSLWWCFHRGDGTVDYDENCSQCTGLVVSCDECRGSAISKAAKADRWEEK